MSHVRNTLRAELRAAGINLQLAHLAPQNYKNSVRLFLGKPPVMTLTLINKSLHLVKVMHTRSLIKISWRHRLEPRRSYSAECWHMCSLLYYAVRRAISSLFSKRQTFVCSLSALHYDVISIPRPSTSRLEGRACKIHSLGLITPRVSILVFER